MICLGPMTESFYAQAVHGSSVGLLSTRSSAPGSHGRFTTVRFERGRSSNGMRWRAAADPPRSPLRRGEKTRWADQVDSAVL